MNSILGHMTAACPHCARPVHVDVVADPHSPPEHVRLVPAVDETHRCPEPEDTPTTQAA